MKILVTGGTGFIGSHTCVELLDSGNEVVIIDNLSNSKIEAVSRIKKITGKDVTFYEGDILDGELLDKIFSENKIDAVIHFAGLKAVGESCSIPLKYYHNNVTGTLILCEAMKKNGCKSIVFSSSATVYGIPDSSPIREEFALHAMNPYGRTKQMIEEILSDLYNSDKEWNITLLRYFNPVGAHESGLIGEDPNEIPNNLMPRLIKSVKGEMGPLTVFGDDYPTRDGTGVRDYIHVVDLAKGHIKALEHIKGLNAYNLGTGKGSSVFELIRSFERANSVKVPYTVVERRPGDIAEYYADSTKAHEQLGWRAQLSLEDMCSSAWNFAQKAQ